MADFLIHFLSPESFWCFVRGHLGACSMHCHCCHRREDSSAENIGQDRWDGIRVHVAFCSTARDHENIVLQSIYLPNHSYPRLRLFSFPFLMQHSLVSRPSYFWCCLYRIRIDANLEEWLPSNGSYTIESYEWNKCRPQIIATSSRVSFRVGGGTGGGICPPSDMLRILFQASINKW